MFKALDERIEEELMLGNVSDVCFGLGHDEEVHLFSCRSSLAMASPVFHAMFFGPQWHKEAAARPSPSRRSDPSSDGLTGQGPATGSNSPRSLDVGQTPGGFRSGHHHYVSVTDIEPSAFKCMLRYVHHLDPMISLDNALQVYRAADKYQIDGLLEGCGSFIEENTDAGNVTQVLRFFDVACRLGLERYSKHFLELLGDLSRVHTRQVLQARDFLHLHTVSLTALLSYEGLCVNEERLWKALRAWAELRAMYREGGTEHIGSYGEAGERKAREVAPSELVPSWQDAIRPLRHLVRFPVMSATFFAKEISKSGVLSHQEVVEIFAFLAAKQARGEALHGESSPADPFAMLDTEAEDAEVRVGGVYRADSRVTRLGWCLAPGQADPMLSEEFGLTEGRELMVRVGSVVVDGRGLSTSSWGSTVILAGPGTGFHLAFGNTSFSSGRHAWTISWRPMDSLQPGRTRCSRGGAAGIARETDGLERIASSSAVSGSTGGTIAGVTGGVSPAPKAAIAANGVQLDRRTSGSVAAPAAAGGAGTEDPSARFLDWPSCVVFGVKREVATEDRYVAWEEDLSSTDVIRFSIVLDFPSRTITYVADRGERVWTASLGHDGPVYPVIAASGPHFFSIEYGCHV